MKKIIVSQSIIYDKKTKTFKDTLDYRLIKFLHKNNIIAYPFPNYDLNEKFHRMVKPMSRRNFVQEGDHIISFSGINQEGDFFQIKDFLGKAVVINFIFTRCFK